MIEKIVTAPENYYFSSTRNYADLDSALDIEVVFMGWESQGLIESNSHGLQMRHRGEGYMYVYWFFGIGLAPITLPELIC